VEKLICVQFIPSFDEYMYVKNRQLFTEFTVSINSEVTDGISRHRLLPYIAYYSKIVMHIKVPQTATLSEVYTVMLSSGPGLGF